ncbi:CLUMA_CG010295, isoform A [Clunio marinus]|uniref:CLUMA_CG010295, isoform A n=1 Tax=Clunio marinus TaxID=568069 RepID=A0A1J1I9J1_9DIPT|nr:CLUMA_CG010295, isoform A [Clunio marinus]
MARRKKKGTGVVRKSYNKSTLKFANDVGDNFIKKWIKSQSAPKSKEYDLWNEIIEIDSDDQFDELECNLKIFEKPLRSLLKKRPDTFLRKRFNLECEWDKCCFESIDQKSYVNHVHDHLMVLSNSQLKCQWNLCKFETEDRTDFLRHLDYHAYHTRLKTFGLGLTNILSIPNCQGDSKLRNIIPSVSADYFCYWNNCTEHFPTIIEYFEHVNSHIKEEYETGIVSSSFRRPNLRSIKVKCLWSQCNKEVPNVFELKRHLKTHTKEKLIGCGNCGALFINKPMFINHCIRQVLNERSFQCNDCLKCYPTKNLLKDHSRSHVNKFQCNLCGLSCQKKSVLARHIQYRHITERPFACDECDYKGKTKQDLDGHSNVHKNRTENPYKCEVFQCNYSSKTLMALKRHDAKEHFGQPQIYACHCCKKTYLRGYLLSRHLMRLHSYRLAPGHSRFIYKRDADGYFRLQTKRVENLQSLSEPLCSMTDEDSNMVVSYEIDKIDLNTDSLINVKLKKVERPKQMETPTYQFFTDASTEDSKDINDFAIVKHYISKRKNTEK